MQRQFSLTHTVRYDECDCDKHLTPAAFVRYMQEMASRDGEDANLGGDGFWIVKRSVIEFRSPVTIHTQLQLKTYGIGFTRITAQRGYEARIAGQDEPVISARTLWVYVDAKGRPARMPDGTAEIWFPDGPQPQIVEEPFPSVPDQEPERIDTGVRFSEIDLMRHMNNTAAIEKLDNAAWEVFAHHEITPDTAQFEPRGYDIEYLSSPRFRDQLEVQTWLERSPERGQDFLRYQQILKDGKVMVRARSRWNWSA